LTENVAEQTKQLSNRIAECERLRVQVDTMQEEIDTTTTGLVESHKEELSSQLAALQKKHLEELTCCKEDLNDVQKEKDGYEKAYEEVGQEVAELRATNQEHVAIINTISQEREQSIKDCAQQILAFNERNEAITSVSKLMVVGGRWSVVVQNNISIHYCFADPCFSASSCCFSFFFSTSSCIGRNCKI
jgi:chromosome segregation ATPase